MSDATLLWILGGIAVCLAAVFVWIHQHSIRDARRESKLDDLGAKVDRISRHMGVGE